MRPLPGVVSLAFAVVIVTPPMLRTRLK